MNTQQRSIAVFFLTLGLGLLGATVCIALVPKIPNEYKATTVAMITDITTEFPDTYAEGRPPEEHRVTVRYEVDGKTYEREMGAYHGYMRAGKTMSIHYDMRDPDRIVLPYDQLTAGIPMLTAGLAFTAFGIYGIRYNS